MLAEWAQALTPYNNQIWVAHARAGTLSIVDDASLKANTININQASFWAITANSRNIYAAGRIEGTADDGLVVMIDPVRRAEIRRTLVPERIAEIISDETHVVALGDKGGIWVFSAGDLKQLRSIKLSTGAFSPSAAIFHEGTLIISSQTYHGENGAVFILQDWRPKTVSSTGTAADGNGVDAPEYVVGEKDFEGRNWRDTSYRPSRRYQRSCLANIDIAGNMAWRAATLNLMFRSSLAAIQLGVGWVRRAHLNPSSIVSSDERVVTQHSRQLDHRCWVTTRIAYRVVDSFWCPCASNPTYSPIVDH